MVRILPFLISLVLSIYALFSCIQTRDEDVPHLPKLIWIVLIVLVPFVGPITWILMSRAHLRKQQVPGRAGHPSAGPRRPAPRSVAPDDDPEFLAWLAKNRPASDRPTDRTDGKPGANDGKLGKSGKTGSEDGKSGGKPGAEGGGKPTGGKSDPPRDPRADKPTDTTDPDDGEAGSPAR
ncbi:PLD nuclease N-terminal domain-containing protein [Kribbella sp. NBC_01245]|uniref:PLD nuclease N-terminal domain-containing protein n=1 Tax=Kribbella sp. NBC_01245 TaxID=2903578 RepID=UPI002E2D6F6E|nr:PLD nuclease N-terminal domain-containing protein [Kribbella sp. NBC_01245]